MTDPELTDRIIAQARALVRAIEALGTIEPSGWLERATGAAAPGGLQAQAAGHR